EPTPLLAAYRPKHRAELVLTPSIRASASSGPFRGPLSPIPSRKRQRRTDGHIPGLRLTNAAVDRRGLGVRSDVRSYTSTYRTRPYADRCVPDLTELEGWRPARRSNTIRRAMIGRAFRATRAGLAVIALRWAGLSTRRAEPSRSLSRGSLYPA